MSTTSTLNPCATITSQIVTLPSIPELYDPNFLDVLIPEAARPVAQSPGETKEVASNAMMDALRSTAHQKLTTNFAPTFSSTLVATLDAYVGLESSDRSGNFNLYLENAWAEDPNLTLRIIWHTRSIHDGKADKELFYKAFGWLFEHHPRTAITNLHCLVDPMCPRSNKDTEEEQKKAMSHGYWKDLLNILALATVDELNPRVPVDPRLNFLHNYCRKGSRPAFVNNQEQEEWSRVERVKRFHHAYDRLTRKLLDKRYRALYIAVARLFAGQLAKESDIMDQIDVLPADANKEDRLTLMRALTLAPKWAPTPGCSHDRVTNISSAISLLLHDVQVPRFITRPLSFSSDKTLPAFDIHSLRRDYQKWVLSRGRQYTCVPEPLMSSNRWSEIVYSRVPSICMNTNKERFFVHDEERFSEYLEDVQSGKKQISGATLLPHKLVMEAEKLYEESHPYSPAITRASNESLRDAKRRLLEAQIKVVDAQWDALVARLRESGELDNCIAICDVSGSMLDISLGLRERSKSAFNIPPIYPALSLSLLVARLARPPFKDSFITFSQSPKLVALEPESSHVSLGSILRNMQQTDWGMNTNFNAVFLKLILPLAVKHRVPQEEMIKRVFVFSDMQFDEARTDRGYNDVWTDEASAAEWKTNHDVIEEAYTRAGYDVPELVYWNLSRAHGITAPVTGEREGVALLSGYSGSLLKAFMGVEEEGEEWQVLDKEGQVRLEKPKLTPVDHMKKTLGRKSFDGLVVVD